jgi:putative ABC transport system permease protein
MLALRVALQNLYFRPVLTVVTLVVVGLAVAQAAVVLLLARAVENSLVRASRPFDLLVGAKGSPTQLIMNAILLQDVPVGNIPLAYFDKLRRDPRVTSAVPLALGDSAYGTPLLGAGLALFALADPATQQPYFALAQGRLFAQTFEAVAGSQAARHWQIGDTFSSQHGFLQEAPGPAHATSYTIVGVLHPSDTPLDRVLFVPLDSYWHLHETDEAAERQITVAMLRPTGLTEVYQLYQEINRDTVAQAVLAGQGMLRLFNILGQGETVLRLVSWLALVMGAATVFLVNYAVGAQRRRETAILRALGTGRWTVFTVGLAEALITACSGVVLGVMSGHVLAWYIAWKVQEASALTIRPGFVSAEWGVGAAVLLLAAAAGLLPAVQAYRQEVASHLG